jgi:pyridoxal phosphate enzyme (YggS family)
LVKSVGLDKLACVETVSTMKLANKLNNAVTSLLTEGEGSDDSKEQKLGIYIQINTSGEESKSGIHNAEELKNLVEGITSDCTNLKILGLMTIGAPGDYSCFDKLVEMREPLVEILGLDSVDELELSMGMSGDFKEAIKRGSTSVRVGSTIFGARDYSKK